MARQHPEDQQHRLSPAGEARREEMLGALVGSMHRVHRNRRIVRRCLVATAVLALSIGTWQFVPEGMWRRPADHLVEVPGPGVPSGLDMVPSPAPRWLSGPRVTVITSEQSAAMARHSSVAYVTDDAGALARALVREQGTESVARVVDPLEAYRARRTYCVRLLTDAELLETLVAMDRPTALARRDGRVFLTSPVTDAQLAEAQIR